MKPSPVQINIDADIVIRKLAIFCVAFEVFLVVLDAIVTYGGLTETKMRHLTNITREDSLASWFATTPTFMVGLTIWLIYLISKSGGRAGRAPAGWAIVAGFFTYMAVDDGVVFHERLGALFGGSARAASGAGGTGLFNFFPSYGWQIIFGPFFAAMGAFILIFLWRELNSGWERKLIVIAILCLCLAVGLDFFEGLAEYGHAWNIYGWFTERFTLTDYTVSHFSKSIEEFLEMLANTLFWVAFLLYLQQLVGKKLVFAFPHARTSKAVR